MTQPDLKSIYLNEEDYCSLMETLSLESLPGMKEKIEEGKRASLFDCVPEDEAE